MSMCYEGILINGARAELKYNVATREMQKVLYSYIMLV